MFGNEQNITGDSCNFILTEDNANLSTCSTDNAQAKLNVYGS
jgi:hypothetical protein